MSRTRRCVHRGGQAGTKEGHAPNTLGLQQPQLYMHTCPRLASCAVAMHCQGLFYARRWRKGRGHGLATAVSIECMDPHTSSLRVMAHCPGAKLEYTVVVLCGPSVTTTLLIAAVPPPQKALLWLAGCTRPAGLRTDLSWPLDPGAFQLLGTT